MDSVLDIIWFVISSFAFIIYLVVFLRILIDLFGGHELTTGRLSALFLPVRRNGQPDR